MIFSGRCAFALSVPLTAVRAVDKTIDPALVAQLKTAATQLDRLNLLPENSDWLFDYSAQPSFTFSPGSVVNANAATFPAAVGNGLTLAMINLGPCSMLPPHYHPRASNYVVAVAGTTDTFFIEENGARLVENTLTPMKMTIFPAASIHTMVNRGCDNAQLVSALSNEDAGTHNIANGLFSLPPELVAVALGYSGVDVNQTASKIPPVGTGSIAGTKECLARCAKQKRSRDFSS
ncbi:spherulin-1A [Xylona heveae TC161]|uniref:Spherulin-1A n=1 Tax=Xylona heveae (strain CBS 132557 / TC161) TaxID=1328760 RepID=A0A165A9G2_XYLHT|nr:spherulin-1A [Xylona heveae TC161]KZF20129.1 spherulin-1A [Xylona heveae TC161]